MSPPSEPIEVGAVVVPVSMTVLSVEDGAAVCAFFLGADVYLRTFPVKALQRVWSCLKCTKATEEREAAARAAGEAEADERRRLPPGTPVIGGRLVMQPQFKTRTRGNVRAIRSASAVVLLEGMEALYSVDALAVLGEEAFAQSALPDLSDPRSAPAAFCETMPTQGDRGR